MRIFRLKIQGQHRLLPVEEDTADIPEGGGPGHPTSRPCSPSGGQTPSSLWQPAHPFFFCGLRDVSGQWHKFLLQKETFGLHAKKISFLVVVYTEISFNVSRVFCKRETNPNLSPCLPTSRFVDALQDQNKDLAELPKVKHWGNGYRYSAFDLPNQLISSLQRNTLGCSCSRSKITGSPDQSRLMN